MNLAAVIKRSKAERENWRYTDVEKLLPLAVIPATCPPKPWRRGKAGMAETCDQHRLTFIDGVWHPEQSQLNDLPQGIMQGDAVSGYRLILAGQTCLVTQPIEIHFVSTTEKETATRLSIELGDSGRLTLIEHHEAATAHIIETNITLHAQAKLVHVKIIKGDANSAHLSLTKAHIAEGAYYNNFTFIKGGKLTRNEIEAHLDGQRAQCTLNGIMLLRGHDHADTTTRIIHAAPYGTSREFYKSVLDEQARGVFQGKIRVEKFAQKTDGSQLNRALLLSDQAEMDAKPELEIYADDVKCSHGSTIGDLDEEALFYLRTRGFDEQQARSLLIEAFISESLEEIQIPETRDLCRAEVKEWYHASV